MRLASRFAVCLAVAAASASTRAEGAGVSGVTLASLSTASLSASWTLAAVSTPTIVLSTNNFVTSMSSTTGTVGQSTAAFADLSPNTTYWFQVKNSTEADSGYVGFNANKATSTPAVAPAAASLPFTGVTVSSFLAVWSGLDNGPGVRYESIQSSGASPATNGFTDNQSSATLNSFAPFAGLSRDTTYYVVVRAINNNGVPTAYASLGSTATLADPPGGGAPSAVVSTGLTVNWTDGGNAAGTRFGAQLALDAAFGGVVGSSITLGITATFSGLTPNTTYFARVVSLNRLGGPSAPVLLPSTSTLAVAAGAVSPAFTDLAASSLRANWYPFDNGAIPRYQAVLSSGASPSTNGFAGNQSSATLNASALFTGLAVNTTYFVDLRVINNNGVPTAYAGVGSAATLAAAPAAAPPGGVLSDRLTANWTPGANPSGTRFLASLAANSGFSPVLATSATAATSATFTGLLPNTTYFTRVSALNHAGTEAGPTVLASTSTLAVTPSSAAPLFTEISASALRGNWSGSENGSGVRYEAVLSSGASPSTNGFAGNQSSATLNPSAPFTGLAVNATYFLDLRAINNNGVPTAYATLGSTSTLANPPASAAPSAVGSDRLSLNWTDGGNPAGTNYLAQLSADAGFASILGSSVTAGVTALFTGLTPNTTYHARAVSLNRVGGASAAAALPSTSTLALPPVAADFSLVASSGLRANWGSAGNGTGVRYEAVLSTGANPGTNGSAGNQSSVTFSTSATFSGLALTTVYFAEVRAVNNNAVPTAYTALGSTRTSASVSAVAAGETRTIVVSAPSGPVSLELPAAAFAQSVSVSAQIPSSFPDPGVGLLAAGAGIEITVNPALQPAAPVVLTIGYSEPLPAGLVEDRLILARHDPARGVWVPLVSTPDPAANAVAARINHFSVFQVMQASTAADLDRVKVFPNPFRPYQGQATVTFINLPASARLRVYSVLGRQVAELTGNAAGMASWDGRDGAGRPASSGIYLVLIEGAGARRSIKVAVER